MVRARARTIVAFNDLILRLGQMIAEVRGNDVDDAEACLADNLDERLAVVLRQNHVGFALLHEVNVSDVLALVKDVLFGRGHQRLEVWANETDEALLLSPQETDLLSVFVVDVDRELLSEIHR